MHYRISYARFLLKISRSLLFFSRVANRTHSGSCNLSVTEGGRGQSARLKEEPPTYPLYGFAVMAVRTGCNSVLHLPPDNYKSYLIAFPRLCFAAIFIDAAIAPALIRNRFNHILTVPGNVGWLLCTHSRRAQLRRRSMIRRMTWWCGSYAKTTMWICKISLLRYLYICYFFISNRYCLYRKISTHVRMQINFFSVYIYCVQ